MAYPLANALFQWEDGNRRLDELRDDPSAHRRALRLIEAVRDELRRRIGATFTAAELADLYGTGTDWCLGVVFERDSAPPADPQELADAAFWLHLRGARDYAGGIAVLDQ